MFTATGLAGVLSGQAWLTLGVTNFAYSSHPTPDSVQNP